MKRTERADVNSTQSAADVLVFNPFLSEGVSRPLTDLFWITCLTLSLCVPAGHCPGPGSPAQSVQLGEDGAESVSVWDQNWNLQLL